jgi:hypothetical protein
MAILMVFLRVLDASMGVGGRNSLLFVGKFGINAHNMPFLRNIKRLVLSTNCTSILKPLDLGIIKCLKSC